jgi:hypothetical protein
LAGSRDAMVDRIGEAVRVRLEMGHRGVRGNGASYGGQTQGGSQDGRHGARHGIGGGSNASSGGCKRTYVGGFLVVGHGCGCSDTVVVVGGKTRKRCCCSQRGVERVAMWVLTERELGRPSVEKEFPARGRRRVESRRAYLGLGTSHKMPRQSTCTSVIHYVHGMMQLAQPQPEIE